jgi:DNA-directed RNA polymerase subunit M/transcription elongation factor TFIIS
VYSKKIVDDYKMVEFCVKCDGMLFPSKDKNKSVLICNSCGRIIPLKDDSIDSYIINKEIDHPPGEEFKNLENMKNWRKKAID